MSQTSTQIRDVLLDETADRPAALAVLVRLLLEGLDELALRDASPPPGG